MFLAYGLVWMDRYSVIYLFPFISNEMDLTNSDLGSAMSIVAITWGISSLVFSVLSDKLGSKKIFLILAILTFSLSTFLSGFVTTFGMLLILRGIMGIAEGPAIPLIQSTIMAESSAKRKGLNVGLVLGGAAILGKGLTPILATIIGSHFDWRVAFYVLAIPGFIIVLLLMKYMREPIQQSKDKPKIKLADYKVILTNKNILLSLFGASLYMAFLFSFTTFLPLFLIEIAEYSETKTGTILSIFGLVLFIWNIVVGIISDKIGRKSTLIIFSLISCLIPLSVLFFYSNFVLLLISLIIFAAGLGYQTLVMFVIPGESVPKVLTASAMALVILVGEVIGGAAGPYISGVLSDTYTLAASMWISFAFSLALFGLSFFYNETAPFKINKQFKTA